MKIKYLIQLRNIHEINDNILCPLAQKNLIQLNTLWKFYYCITAGVNFDTIENFDQRANIYDIGTKKRIWSTYLQFVIIYLAKICAPLCATFMMGCRNRKYSALFEIHFIKLCVKLKDMTKLMCNEINVLKKCSIFD